MIAFSFMPKRTFVVVFLTAHAELTLILSKYYTKKTRQTAFIADHWVWQVTRRVFRSVFKKKECRLKTNEAKSSFVFFFFLYKMLAARCLPFLGPIHTVYLLRQVQSLRDIFLSRLVCRISWSLRRTTSLGVIWTPFTFSHTVFSCFSKVLLDLSPGFLNVSGDERRFIFAAFFVKTLVRFALLQRSQLDWVAVSHPYRCLHHMIMRVATNMFGICCIGARLADFGHLFAKYAASLPSADFPCLARQSTLLRIMCFHRRSWDFSASPRKIMTTLLSDDSRVYRDV